MFTMLLLAHLLGDYVLQFNALVRWKTRSLWGVAAHGAIVSAATLLAAALVSPAWWPYALLIGLSHTLIDVVRARLIRPAAPNVELLLFLLDQSLHVSIIALLVHWTGAPTLPQPTYSWLNLRAATPIAGLLLLLQPAWVLLRFLVRGVWGAAAAPPLGIGEKYRPMLERVAIALLAFAGVGYLIPLALLPARIERLQGQEHSIMIMIHSGDSWIETMLSILLALSVGLGLRHLGWGAW